MTISVLHYLKISKQKGKTQLDIDREPVRKGNV